MEQNSKSESEMRILNLRWINTIAGCLLTMAILVICQLRVYASGDAITEISLMVSDINCMHKFSPYYQDNGYVVAVNTTRELIFWVEPSTASGFFTNVTSSDTNVISPRKGNKETEWFLDCKSVGTVKLIASVNNNWKQELEVKVVPVSISIDGISLSGSYESGFHKLINYSMDIGQKVYGRICFDPKVETFSSLVITNSNPQVATAILDDGKVSSNAKVYYDDIGFSIEAKSSGTTTITFTEKNSGESTSLNLTVNGYAIIDGEGNSQNNNSSQETEAQSNSSNNNSSADNSTNPSPTTPNSDDYDAIWPAIKKITSKKGKVTITLKKKATRAKYGKQYYTVEYKIKGKKKWKKLTFDLDDKLVIKKLKKGKYYQFRVAYMWRPYQKSKTKSHYSSVKIVKIK